MDNIAVLTESIMQPEEDLSSSTFDIVIQECNDIEDVWCHLYVLSSSETIGKLRELKEIIEVTPVDDNVSCLFVRMDKGNVINALMETFDGVRIFEEF